ncbi:tryptophan synthase subunit alpha [Clostridium sediminicola]|uniref:tryptophan synthase subunit alpha n=1 Tax=Clostridium sediminicola TaxID=3114879 RepID=UPI0031F26CDB
MDNLKEVLKDNKRLLTLYMTLAYPSFSEFLKYLDILVENQVDILEIGIPVQNPYLDGKVISQTYNKVKVDGFDKIQCLNMLKEIRNRYPKLPIVIMSYYEGIVNNSLLENSDLYDALLCPDEFLNNSNKLIQIYNEDMTDKEIIDKLNYNSYFAYVMSSNSPTGSIGEIPTNYINTINRIRKYSDIPVQVGFGISTAKQAKEILCNGSDGIIIGSEIIRKINENNIINFEAYIDELRGALLN